MELSVKEAAKQVAFKYRDEKEKNKIVDVTYEENSYAGCVEPNIYNKGD